MKRTKLASCLVAVVLLVACKEEVAVVPDPVSMTSEALSHFCLMQVDQHPGPKAQVHLEGFPEPIFFAQVRDALAYVKGPERDGDILAFYVSDMSAAQSWEDPGIDNWIDASAAHFVVGADVTGGMGAPEIVPFSEAAGAQDFVGENGGEVMALDQIPAETVLAPVDIILEELPS